MNIHNPETLQSGHTKRPGGRGRHSLLQSPGQRRLEAVQKKSTRSKSASFKYNKRAAESENNSQLSSRATPPLPPLLASLGDDIVTDWPSTLCSPRPAPHLPSYVQPLRTPPTCTPVSPPRPPTPSPRRAWPATGTAASTGTGTCTAPIFPSFSSSSKELPTATAPAPSTRVRTPPSHPPAENESSIDA